MPAPTTTRSLLTGGSRCRPYVRRGSAPGPRPLLRDGDAQEWFALNVFLRGGDEIYRTYFLQNGTM